MPQLSDFILSKHFRVSRHLIRNMDLLRKQRKGIPEDAKQETEPLDKAIEPTAPTEAKEIVEASEENDSQEMTESSKDEVTQDDHED